MSDDDIIVALPPGSDLSASPYPPFYCVHAISGNAVAEFRHLAGLITPVPFLAIQVPQAQRHPATAESIRLMAARYCDEVLAYHWKHFGDSPFILGGWSAGVIVALDMAQQLKAANNPPLMLVAIDKCPRHTKAEIGPWNSTPRNIGLWLKRSIRNSDTWSEATRSLYKKLWLVIRHRQLYGGPDSEYDSAVVIRNLVDNSSRLSPSERAFIQAFYELTTGYIPAPYKGKVLVMVTKDGWKDRVVEGWKEIAWDHKIVRLPGSHASVMLGVKPRGGGRLNLADVRTLAGHLRYEFNFFRRDA